MTCNDPQPHGPHTWYEPNPTPGGGGQIQQQCPGVK
jgi:hypothetical protein